MTKQRACATATTLPKRTAPGDAYHFHCEADADLATFEGRVQWFCSYFDVTPPKIEYDEDEPEHVLMTDELLQWTQDEGVCLNWLASARVTRLLEAHRRIELRALQTATALKDMDQGSLSAILFATRLLIQERIDVDDAMQLVRAAREQPVALS